MTMGLYSGAASIHAFERRHEAMASNLANLYTPGYRRRVEALVSREIKGPARPVHRGRGVQAPRFFVAVDFTPGEIHATGGDFDVALTSIDPKDGNAFLAVETKAGEKYTRNGRLSLDGRGRLVHASTGYPMLNPNGFPITLNPQGGPPVIDNRGNVSQNGVNAGRLKVVRFDRLDQLKPANHGLYETSPLNPMESAIGRVEVRQGYLESSNAQPVDEMVEMIANYRSYEAAQRVVRQTDESLQKLLRQTA